MFIFAGSEGIPVIYDVEILHDTEDRITQIVHAKQETRLIFIATISFMKPTQASRNDLTHYVPKPDIHPPPKQSKNDERWDADRPFETIRVPLSFGTSHDNDHAIPLKHAANRNRI